MTSPYLHRPHESEATARQRLACERAGVAYVPPRPVSPWDGHPEDVLWSDDYQPPRWPLRFVGLLVLVVFIVLAGAGILWSTPARSAPATPPTAFKKEFTIPSAQYTPLVMMENGVEYAAIDADGRKSCLTPPMDKAAAIKTLGNEWAPIYLALCNPPK